MQGAMSEAERAPAIADKGQSPADGAGGFSSAVVTIPLPRIFGRLLLLKLLARGGMGDVYLAATTGIHSAEDVLKMLMAGADVTMLASALLKHGPQRITEILTGLTTPPPITP